MDFTIFGYIGVLLTGTHLIPEVYKAIHTQHLRDVAWSMLILFLGGSLSWAIYGYHLQDIPIIASASLNTSATSILIILKILYKKNDQPIAEYIKVRSKKKKDRQ
ncbi:MAG: hypothetical protein R3B71_03425 [Candidatus Gracilibacteria bacterium]|nr:hypothetical protein [Candidatus Peregrinibacteria bacterium]